MIGGNRRLVTDEPVEVQDCRKFTDHLRGIYRIYPNLTKENRRISTCDRLDLQTLGFQPVMPKNLYDHWHVRGLTNERGESTNEQPTNVRGGFWVYSIKILVLPSPTGYVL